MSLRESERQALQRCPRNKPVETEAQRRKRLAKEKADRIALRQTLCQDPDAILTKREWASLNGFSMRQASRILASGEGPTITNLTGKRIGISRRSNLAWQQARTQKR
jgi:hypothetical protein